MVGNAGDGSRLLSATPYCGIRFDLEESFENRGQVHVAQRCLDDVGRYLQL